MGIQLDDFVTFHGACIGHGHLHAEAFSSGQFLRQLQVAVGK